MLSISILGIKENRINKLKEIDNTTCDFIHLDIMDGLFVSNKIDYNDNYQFNKRLDIHLMVEDVEKYIEEYKKLKPYSITFHLEIKQDIEKIINILQEENIKIGVALKPNTDIEELIPYLKIIDLVLVMSVEPGYGGQKFIDASVSKINKLKDLREKNNYNYLIEVDGGINDETIKKVENADIKVVGSYVTKSNNYEEQISILKKLD